MNQNKKTFIFLFGGMAVMVVTTVCGAVIMIALDDAAGGSLDGTTRRQGNRDGTEQPRLQRKAGWQVSHSIGVA